MITILLVLVVLVGWVIKLHLTREVIQEPDGSVYMVRYFIWSPKNKKRNKIYLHHFLRSDHDRATHSHPWSYKSIILWGGYWEIADTRLIPTLEMIPSGGIAKWILVSPNSPLDGSNYRIRWFPVLSRLFRPAEWRHQIILPEGKTVWTLVRTYGKEREWRFHLSDDSFCHHTKYDLKTGLCHE